MLRNAAIVGLGCLLANASGPEGPLRAAPQQFRIGVEIVEVTVTVTDEGGRPVTGLTREDFTILEEGRPQTVTVFSQVDVPPPPPRPVGTATAPAPVSVTANDVAPDGRVFALVLDDQLTQPFRTLSVRRLARQFVEQHVGPTDLVGVFSTGGRGALTQEFTTDHARVLRTIDRFQGNRIRAGQTDPERVYGIVTAMDTIAKLAEHLNGIRGRRVAMLLISEGIDYNIYQAMKPSAIPGNLSPADVAGLLGARSSGGSGATEDRELEPTPVIRAVEEALAALSRANVVLYGIDPRGLYSPDGEWLEFNPNDKAAAPPPTPEEHSRSIQSLRTISGRTGGFALVNTNEFGPDFGRIVDESSHYYVLGYSPSSRSEPGEYRRISVRVRPGLRASTREGYVVPVRSTVPPSRPVLAALEDSLPQPHLPLRVQVIPLPSSDLGGRMRPVQVIVEIDGGALTFREEDGRFSERVELAVKTIDHLAHEGHWSATEMTLPPLTATQRDRIIRSGIRWLTTLEAAPGVYSLRVAAQAMTNGRIGSVFVNLDVPPIVAPHLFLGELAVTSTSAAETPTAGTPSLLRWLPAPATTRRVFRQGETISVAAAVEGLTVPATAAVYRLDANGEHALGSRVVPLSKSDGGVDYLLFSLPPELFQPGRFAIRLSAQGLGGEQQQQQQREVVIEIRPNTP